MRWMQPPTAEELLRAVCARVSLLEWRVNIMEPRLRDLEGDRVDWQALADWYEDGRGE